MYLKILNLCCFLCDGTRFARYIEMDEANWRQFRCVAIRGNPVPRLPGTPMNLGSSPDLLPIWEGRQPRPIGPL